MNFPKAYILHCKTLTERKVYMQKKLQSLEIESEWITEHDAIELTSNLINQYYVDDKQKCLERVRLLWPISQHQSRRLRDTEISLAIKHCIAIEKISKNDEEYGLVLEDDCLFVENFKHSFEDLLKKTPSNWDVIHVGNGYGMKPENYKEIVNEKVYLMNHPASRCAEAILIKKSAANKINNTIKPFYLAADWEYGYQYHLHNLNVYWWEPSLITQGSHNGHFKSSLR